MQTAALTGVLRTILWLLVGWFIFRTISGFFKSAVVRGPRPDSGIREPGDISIDKVTPPSKDEAVIEAEYVEFEEIDEDKT